MARGSPVALMGGGMLRLLRSGGGPLILLVVATDSISRMSPRRLDPRFATHCSSNLGTLFAVRLPST
eukprot:8465803-Pyramimonas_sp.AAC.1